MTLVAALLFTFILAADPAIPLDQHSAPSPWDTIQTLETLIERETSRKIDGIHIQSGDPVRGYVMEDVELVLIVPVHHVMSQNPFANPSRSGADKVVISTPTVIESIRANEQRARIFKEEQYRKKAIKEANFESYVREMIQLMSTFKKVVGKNCGSMRVRIIVEERERLWITNVHSGDTQYRRQVVTLSIHDLQEFSGKEGDIHVVRDARKIKAEYQPKPF